jgi:hypothetical protein
MITAGGDSKRPNEVHRRRRGKSRRASFALPIRHPNTAEIAAESGKARWR